MEPLVPPPFSPTTTTVAAVYNCKTSGGAPTILGKYKLGRLLGRGSFAKVYHAQSIVDSTPVAVKIIDKSKTVDAAMEPRIVREVSAMRRLHHHPNILKIYEVMATKTKIYLVVELAKGGELFSKIALRGRLTESAARRYFQQLVSALNFCHQNGVAHRDLKPQNLLLDHEGNLKVSDFGLSALPEQLKNGLLHTACGTPAYTAPEVVIRSGGGGYDGAKADAWSCGVILYVFLAGFMPFDDSNLATMYKKIHRREYQFPAWISRPARSVIVQLLDPNPKTRLSTEALMNLNWFKKSIELNPQCSLFQSDIIRSKSLDSVLGSNTQIMNAFDIISLSSGLDLSGLFEVTSRKEKRFTTAASMEAMVERVGEVGERLGYGVERGKIGSIGLMKGRLVLLVEVSEVTQSLLLVEVKVVDGGGVDFEEVHWGDLKAGFEDIALSWHNDVI